MPEKYYKNIENSIFSLIEKTSTNLPEDIVEAMENAKKQEKTGSNAIFSLETLSENIEKAKQKTVPMCQDTGFLTFYITHSPEYSQKFLKKAVISSVQKATENGLLRPNAVDSLTGKNSGDNTGISIPKIVFTVFEGTDIETNCNSSLLEIQLLLKGGGSENVSDQFSLPCQTDFGRAGRDLSGVKKAILQCVKNAEGKGCAPGILGIHIGGDRATGYEKAKLNFFRNVADTNPEISLQQLELEVLEEANALGIGPMGFGGESTILGAKISASHRIPASFFVTVAYSCWALRRGKIVCDEYGNIEKNLKEADIIQPDEKDKNKSSSPENTSDACNTSLQNKNSEISLRFPLSESEISALRVGDKVLLSGKIFTGRDTIHHYVVEENHDLPKHIEISGSAIYHCGPVMKNISEKNEEDTWEVIAAGPTTSIREEPYQAGFIQKTGIRGIIGKGGMGEKTLQALQEYKAVYFHAIGGAATVYAEKITEVTGVNFLEKFGVPEAMWELEIKDFPVIVTMDSHGKTLTI